MATSNMASASLLFFLIMAFFWIAGAIVVAAYRSKHCSFLESLVISLLFSPMIGLLINILEELKARQS